MFPPYSRCVCLSFEILSLSALIMMFVRMVISVCIFTGG